MKQLLLVLTLGIATSCYNPRPITMTITRIEKIDESEQRKVWGTVGNRVLRAVLDRLPDSLRVGSEITLLPASKAHQDSARGRTFRMIRR